MTASSLNKNKFFAYALFLVWPFLALIFAAVNYRSSYAKNIVWLFCGFFGYTFIISNPEMDANRYRDKLIDLHERRYEPYWDLMVEPFQQGIYSSTDVYSQVVTLTLSRFTDDFRILFGVVGLVFGYFYSRNLFYIIDWIKRDKLNFLGVMLLITLALIVPFWNINGYRYYTATHMLIYGLLKIIVEKRYRYWLLIFFTPLIHGSFALGVGCAVAFKVIGYRYNLYLIALIAMLSGTGLDPSLIYKNADLAPTFMQNKVSGYTRDSYIKFVQNNLVGLNWYVLGHLYAIKFVLYSFIGLVWWKRKVFLTNHLTKGLYSCGLFLLAISTFISSIPSADRFFLVSFLPLTVLLFYMAQTSFSQKWVNYLSVAYIGPLFVYILVEIRSGFDFIGLNSIFLNPMTAPFFPDSPALINFFK